ncbi:MAG: substrate-binding domain-containing protein [Oscillospiraceae bacterium]|nr:substrate-binding domain-containing protein [Oscillospiraceae bacterium]
MKKMVLFLVAVSMLVLSSSRCTPSGVSPVPEEINSTRPAQAADVLRRVMPGQMEDGAVKVAVIRNLSNSDHTKLFLSGCIVEGVSLGFEVDTFITNGDNGLCREYIAQAIAGDYDGIILSHVSGYAYDALLPAIEKGIKVVTFDSTPYKNDNIGTELLPGVTSTAQEDFKLAELSLNAITDYFDHSPVRVVRTHMSPDILPLDNRKTVFDRYVREGKIEEAHAIDLTDGSQPRASAKKAFGKLLKKIPEGSVDAIWGNYDELAKGCLDALLEAGRRDIKIMSIDISDNDMELMRTNQDIWVSTAAVDPSLIGKSNMRLLAMKFAGEESPDTYYLDAQLVETSKLDYSTNMTNIGKVVDGWGVEEGVFDDYDWMEELKALTHKY